MLRLKVPQRKLEEALLAMNQHRDQTHMWVMGVSESPQQNLKELLYHEKLRFADTDYVLHLKPGVVPVLVQTMANSNKKERESFLRRFDEASAQVGLLFRIVRDNLRVSYVYKPRESVVGPVSLLIPGPFMEHIMISPLDEEEGIGEKMQNASAPDTHGFQLTAGDETEWQYKFGRLAGAVGMGDIDLGFNLLRRAQELVVAVVGAGRAGSQIVLRLAQHQVGAKGALILVDPDLAEPSNLDGTIIAHEAVGYPKVFGVGGTIAGMTGNKRCLKCLPVSLSDQEALNVVRTADVIFTAVDEPAARLAAAILAARYHIVHIDVVGGMAWTNKREAIAGGELRVFVPGSQGCLGCQDRYDWRQALHLLSLSSEDEQKRRQNLNWREFRPGSSVDILLPVVGEALQCFWAILRGDVKDSLWWHYEKYPNGRPLWSDWSGRRVFGSQRMCGICGKQVGLGDIII